MGAGKRLLQGDMTLYIQETGKQCMWLEYRGLGVCWEGGMAATTCMWRIEQGLQWTSREAMLRVSTFLLRATVCLRTYECDTTRSAFGQGYCLLCGKSAGEGRKGYSKTGFWRPLQKSVEGLAEWLKW